MKKTRSKKCDTVPLSHMKFFIYIPKLDDLLIRNHDMLGCLYSKMCLAWRTFVADDVCPKGKF